MERLFPTFQEDWMVVAILKLHLSPLNEELSMKI